jgi:protein TonB
MAMPAALAITLILFVLMQRLISAPPVTGTQAGLGTSIRFGVRIEPIVPTIKKTPPKREERKDPPPHPPTDIPVDHVLDRTPPPIQSPPLTLSHGPGLAISSLGSGSQSADSPLIPVVRIQAQYPRMAELRGLQGSVVVEFTVTMTGEVINARVVDANPRRIFDQAALKAIAKWRFRPQRIAGKAVARTVQQVFVFKLEKDI